MSRHRGRSDLAKRLRAGGLRRQLTVWVGAVMLISFGAIFFVVYRDTGSEVRAQIDRDITGDVGQLGSALRPSGGLSPRQISAAATRYVRGQPFTATLLFVLEIGRAHV